MARLIDVARLAGVSRSTASNVFNNPQIVRSPLRDRVEAAARELGYAGPDPKGRLLRQGRFNALAVMPPSEWSLPETLRNPVFSLLLQGIGEVCDENGANLLISSGRLDRPSVASALVDGVIFARFEQLSDVEPAILRKIPFAVIDFDAGQHINSVRADARKGACLAATHLLQLGHRRFAIMSFLRNRGAGQFFPAGAARSLEAAGNLTDQEKLLGYGDAFAQAGIDIANVPIYQADAYDQEAPGRLLDAAPDATAILSMSVMQAIGIIEAAKQRGIRIPQDLSVVGYNDTPGALLCDPPLTTVDSKTLLRGREAARLVFGRASGKHVVMEPELIIRASTAEPHSGDTSNTRITSPN